MVIILTLNSTLLYPTDSSGQQHDEQPVGSDAVSLSKQPPMETSTMDDEQVIENL